jgi:hypothetical protein
MKLLERWAQITDCHELEQCRTLPTRDDESLHGGQLGGGFYQGPRDAKLVQHLGM